MNGQHYRIKKHYRADARIDLSYRTENQFAVKPFDLSKRNKADLAQFCTKKVNF